MLFRLTIAIIIIWFGLIKVEAQTGGSNSYNFLTLQPSARIAALGGSAIATYENDINLAVQNPALLRSSMSNQLGFSHVFYLADIQAGYITWAHAPDSSQIIGGGIQYVNYGSFTKTTSNGEVLGSFMAGDYSFNCIYSRRLDSRWQVGGQVKVIYSSLGEYNTLALAIDAGITYHDPGRKLTVSAVMSNVGKQMAAFNNQNDESLPFNLQVGASKKLQNAPFRFSAVVNHLERPGKLIFQNLNKPSLQKDLETGDVIPENISIGSKVMSHVNLSAELLFGQAMYLGFGYNYLRRWEMGLKDLSGMSGFSWGFGINMTRWRFGYARSSYIINQSTDHFSIILNLNKQKRS